MPTKSPCTLSPTHCRQTDRQADRQTERKTGRQAGRQASRQADSTKLTASCGSTSMYIHMTTYIYLNANMCTQIYTYTYAHTQILRTYTSTLYVYIYTHHRQRLAAPTASRGSSSPQKGRAHPDRKYGLGEPPVAPLALQAGPQDRAPGEIRLLRLLLGLQDPSARPTYRRPSFRSTCSPGNMRRRRR
jgi:hypothetical protein